MKEEQQHWLGMPEFHQEKQEPFAAINIRFGTAEDLDAFCAATGLKLTKKTKSAWYPEKPDSIVGSLRWK